MDFVKMHGIGNDYIFIDAINQKIENLNNLAIILSDRHFGIGSDGLVTIEKSDVADCKMRIFNSDGTEAEICGNAIRCVGKYLYDYKLTNKEIITVETKAGIKTLCLAVKKNKIVKIKVDMGNPIFSFEKIPALIKKSNNINYPLNVNGKIILVTILSMGNPHCIIITDEEISDKQFEEDSKIIQNNEVFPNKTNVEWVKVIDRKTIKVRVYERGAGETLACGSGACASVVATVLNQRTDNEVKVILKGGELDINWSDSVYMSGEATMVFKGNIDID
jgi:diaminopimelate epimerase